MKQREIKFRVWDGVDYMTQPFTLQDLQHGHPGFASDTTVMQYTGLKDKNGVEIYEGDILKEGKVDSMVVSYVDELASFGLNRKGWMYMHYFGEGVYAEKCEVLGNVHQHPDLLK